MAVGIYGFKELLKGQQVGDGVGDDGCRKQETERRCKKIEELEGVQ